MDKFSLTLLLAIITSTVYSQYVATPIKEDYDKVFTLVEKEAMFPGGLAGWKKYLEANLKAHLAADYINLKENNYLRNKRCLFNS